jgi:hypothetical protein
MRPASDAVIGAFWTLVLVALVGLLAFGVLTMMHGAVP